ncbi:MAG: rhamnulokinase family protein [Pirellulaceae bacterium]
MPDISKVYLAADLGASSGRVVAGLFDGSRLELEDVYRFENGGMLANDRLYWDLLAQWSHIQEGLRAAAASYGDRISSVGVDTWGVDFGLLGRNDELLANPYHYRDARTTGMMGRAFSMVSREEIFAETGLQFMELNTLYQMLAMKLENSPLLDVAERFLMMPDLFHWLLTGEKANEFTNASTTQFYNPLAKGWSIKLFEQFGLPTQILGRIVQPGTRLGRVRRAVADSTGLKGVEVVLPGTHDTASAVMAVPASGAPSDRPDWCYISSGTWSLMGMETPSPVVSEPCSRFNFTNEGGVGGTTRLLKNIAGLWLLQECRRIWALEGREFSWDDMVQRAQAARPLVSLVDPDAGAFLAPKEMPQAIRQFCAETGQATPEAEGAVVRCALESLALRYRMVLNMAESLTGSRVETIHIVGGGTQNRLLCQMAADACNRHVLAGPVEATAIGNVMMQAVAGGDVASIAEARKVIRDSFPMHEYDPQNAGPWDEAFERFEKIVHRQS